MSDSAVNEIWTGGELRAVTAELRGSPPGTVPALAERLRLDRRLVRRWISGTTPLPADAAARIQEITGASVSLETGWRRDEWLVANGSAQASGGGRVYITRQLAAVFERCRDRAGGEGWLFPSTLSETGHLTGLHPRGGGAARAVPEHAGPLPDHRGGSPVLPFRRLRAL